MSIIKTLTDTRPSLILDFANGHQINPAIIHARTGTASVVQDGLVIQAQANVPRLDLISGLCRGLLSEGPSTNLFLNSKLINGTNWTVSSSGTTLTLLHNQPSLVAGASATKITTLEIANATSRGWTQNISATPNTTYTFSVYLKMAEGSKPCQVRLRAGYIRASDGHGVYLADMWHAFTQYSNSPLRGNEYIGDGWWRAYLTVTTPADISHLNIGVWMVDDKAAFQFTGGGHSVYVTAPQVEQQASMTSPILTDPDATASRAADNTYIDIESFISAQGFTMAYVGMSNFASEYSLIFSDTAAGLGNYIGLRNAPGGSYINSIEGSRTNAVVRPNVRSRIHAVCTFSNAYSAGYIDDLYTRPGTLQYAVDDYSKRRYMKFNQIQGNNIGWASIERVLIWNRVMTQAELAVISKLLK